jgi:hypothetical protein
MVSWSAQIWLSHAELPTHLHSKPVQDPESLVIVSPVLVSPGEASLAAVSRAESTRTWVASPSLDASAASVTATSGETDASASAQRCEFVSHCIVEGHDPGEQIATH